MLRGKTIVIIKQSCFELLHGETTRAEMVIKKTIVTAGGNFHRIRSGTALDFGICKYNTRARGNIPIGPIVSACGGAVAACFMSESH